MMQSFHIITPRDPLYPQVIDLRQRILRAPLGLDIRDEDLEEEADQVIFVAEAAGMVAGCLLLQHVDAATFKLRQMAVDTAGQGKGIGARLVAVAEQYARSQGKTRMILHARITAVPFYRKSGYEIRGGTFMEVGIPHVLMEKPLP